MLGDLDSSPVNRERCIESVVSRYQSDFLIFGGGELINYPLWNLSFREPDSIDLE